ncbi:hypothetical protein [Streptomyces sp. NPDC054804]
MDYDRVEAQADAIRELRRDLSDYADGLAEVDPADQGLVETVNALRQLLETIYGCRITFRGESREQSGATVDVRVAAEAVDGYVAAVRARLVANAHVKADLKVGTIGSDGKAVGLDVGNLGD